MEKPQLFLLHFAGGSSYSFQFMNSFLGEFNVIAIELPGRGKRIHENLLKDFGCAAEDIYNQITSNLNTKPFLIYGHSMGAYIGLRVSIMLQNIGKAPGYLIVSGNAGPGSEVNKHDKSYLLQEGDFIKRLISLGGIPEEIINDKEVFRFFEPIIRADFELIEKNSLVEFASIKCPIYALMGSREKHVSKISNWSRFTESNFEFEILEGGHFFIHQHATRIAAVLMNCYDRISKK